MSNIRAYSTVTTSGVPTEDIAAPLGLPELLGHKETGGGVQGARWMDGVRTPAAGSACTDCA